MLINQPEECAKVLVKLTNLSMEDQMTVLKDITWIKGSEQKGLMVQPGDFVTGMQQLADFLVKHQQIDEAPKVKQWIAESMVP
jgi:taurine transport system substrate-binding protein